MYSFRYNISKIIAGREAAMECVSYSGFRQNLRRYLDKTRDDACEILVTSQDPTANVVVMSASEYDSIMETLRIYENPYLHGKILEGMAEAGLGHVSEHDLIPVDEEEAALA